MHRAEYPVRQCCEAHRLYDEKTPGLFKARWWHGGSLQWELLLPLLMELLGGVKHFTEQLALEPGTLVIVDNMQASHAHLVSAWFMPKCHHYDTKFIIHVVQNVFDKDPSYRTVRLIATYIILFKNPRDMCQVSYLDRQVNPGSNGLLTAANHGAMTGRAHSYMVIHFNQATPEKLPLCNTLFPDEDFPEMLVFGPTYQPEDEGGPTSLGRGKHKDHLGIIHRHALTMAAGICAARVRHQPPIRRGHCRQQHQWWGHDDSTAAARKHHRCRTCPCPLGMIPCDLRRHADAICILAKAQLKVVKQLVAGADKDLINTLSEWAANIHTGNMILQPPQKQRLSKHADALRALRWQTVSQCTKKALLMDGGFVDLLAGIVALLLMKALPSIVGSVGSLVKGPRRGQH